MKDPTFEYTFSANFGGGVVTLPMRLETWGKKQKGAIRFVVLSLIVPLLEEWLVEVKVNQTMSDADRQAKKLVELWKKEEKEQAESHIEYAVTKDPDSPFGIKEMRATDKRFY